MRRFLARVRCCLLAAAPGVRPSRPRQRVTAGVEANGPSGPPSISADGRYVVFASAATNLVAGDTNGASPTSSCAIATPTRTASSTRPARWRPPASASGRRGAGRSAEHAAGRSTADGRYVAFVVGRDQPRRRRQRRRRRSTAWTARPARSSASARARPAQPGDRRPRTSLRSAPTATSSRSRPAATNLDRQRRRCRRGTSTSGQITADHDDALTPVNDRQRSVASTTRSRRSRPTAPRRLLSASVALPLSRDAASTIARPGTTVAEFRPRRRVRGSVRVGPTVVVRASRPVQRRTSSIRAPRRRRCPRRSATPPIQPAVSPSARYVLRRAHGSTTSISALDELGFVPGGGAFSADDRWLAVVPARDTAARPATPTASTTSSSSTCPTCSTPTTTRWTTAGRRCSASPIRPRDPDADGQTNAQEEDAGTHPNGQVRRFLAEGATGAFFHTPSRWPTRARRSPPRRC